MICIINRVDEKHTESEQFNNATINYFLTLHSHRKTYKTDKSRHASYAVPRFLSYSHLRERVREDPGNEFDMLCCVCVVDVIVVYLTVLLSLRS